ncbi:MAG TPA: acetyl-CoA hydrolase/transferase C-terminal domain-containing protein [Burkholderiales bacterium]|nr:acetyl-CoA hydrolase/transferase C-terminal domain-containing protein [Burkholderiales bacterium]
MSSVDLSSVIRPGDGLLWGQACAEPQTLVEALIAQREALSRSSVFLGISYSGLLRPEHADHLRFTSYCGTGSNRALAQAGVLEILPSPYSRLGELLRSGRIKCDVAMVQVSPPNARGEYSLGLAVEYLAPALEVARAVIAEVNDQIPWTRTKPVLRRDDFDLVVQTSRPPVYLYYGEPSEVDRAIARHAAALVPEGATVECGIGALPNAILTALAGRDIRYHSGVVCEAVRLVRPKSCLGGVLMGTQALFDWARENPALELVSSDVTHGAATLARIERFVAINSAVEVDLTGQVNGEVARGTYVGAVGGALDFIRAANQSPGGLAITALPAARIVERLSGPVSVPRSEAGVFVTERGVADLRGCTLAERARRLQRISGSS